MVHPGSTSKTIRTPPGKNGHRERHSTNPQVPAYGSSEKRQGSGMRNWGIEGEKEVGKEIKSHT